MDADNARDDADRVRRRQRSAGITTVVLAFVALALVLDAFFGCRLASCKEALMANVAAILVTIVIVMVFFGIRARVD